MKTKTTIKLLLQIGTLCLSAASVSSQTFTNMDVGSPTLAGSVTLGGNTITIVGGGNDIWNNSDNFHYYFAKMAGPFDVRVRVESLNGPDTWTKAELMARQDDGTGIPQGGDPHISNMTTRTGGQNEVNLQYRQARDGASNWPGTPATPIRPTYPNTWLRMVRSGNIFALSYSTNGQNWQPISTVDTGDTNAGWQPWPNNILIGLAVTAHNDADAAGATGVFHDLQFATNPVVNVAATGASLDLQILEVSPSLAVASVTGLTLDSTNDVTSKIAQNKSGTVTTVKYDPLASTGQFFASGSAHTLQVVFRDTGGNSYTNGLNFVVQPYVSVPESFAVTGVETTKPGFLVRPYQTEDTQPNTLAWTEEQLAGLHGTNFVDLVTLGADTNGFVVNDQVINYDMGGLDHGNFTSMNGYPESMFPGLPAGISTGNGNNSSIELLTYLQFTAAGLYTMGVNSDDGFKVTTAKNPRDRFGGLVLGYFDAGRGAADTLFTFTIPKPGIYPFRLIWENGGGDANVEWFTVVNGKKILVNDTATAGAIKAYRVGPAGPAYTKMISPADAATGVAVTNIVQFTLQNADTQVNPASISLKFQGQTVTPVVTTASGTTIVTYDPPGNLGSSSNYTAVLTWSDTASPANTTTAQTSFLTERLAITLPAFQEDSTGLTVIELENFHGLTPQGGSTWSFGTTLAGYSGQGYMESTPNAGINRNVYPDLLTLSPRLDYRVNFLKSGRHYIWVRGNMPSGSDDSLHAGIDGDNPDGARRIDNSFSPNNQWVWVGQITGTNPDTGDSKATITVPTVGEHVVNIWMREDGSRIDKIILTTDAGFVPSDTGPDESRHVGQAPPPSATITSPTNGASFAAGANITITATASDVDGTITNVAFYAGTNLIGNASASPYTVTWSSVPTGRYTIRAKATDNNGEVGTSAAVKLIVGTPNPVALFVLANPGSMNASDTAVMNRLKAFGYDVTSVGDAASQTSDAADAEIIVISSTVGSGNVGNKFRDVAVPVLNWEQALQDNFLMTTDEANVTRGETTSQTDIVIADATHPMAAGLSAGVHTVTTAAATFTWGVPGPEAKIVATLNDGTGNAALYGYNTGALLIDGTTRAPARRVHIFLQNDTFALLNADGLKLFDAAASWAVNRTLTPRVESKFNAVKVQNGKITLSWSGPGTLQESDSPAAGWQDSASQANPQDIIPSSPRRFYRIKQ